MKLGLDPRLKGTIVPNSPTNWEFTWLVLAWPIWQKPASFRRR
jgi:hypothetical protein